MSKLEKLYTRKQIEVLKITHEKDRFMLINHGAKRSGKTVINNDLFLMELRRIKKIADSLSIPEPMYILAGVSSKTIQNNILTELSNKYGMEFKFDKHGSFKLFGVKVVQAFTGTIGGLGGIRGMTAFGAYINEASLARQEVFAEIISRCSGPGARILVDTNPDNPEHRLLKNYIQNKDENILSFKFTLDDNTFLTERYIKNIKASTPDGMFYERDIYGNWVSGQGVVYSVFNANKHYVKSIKDFNFKKYIAGVDWGYGHYGVIVVFGITEDDKYVMIEEFAETEKEIDYRVEVAKKINKKYKKIPFYCDTARVEHIDRFKREGIRALYAKKEVIEGIEEVAILYKTQRLFIYEPIAKRFKEEIYSYVWAENSSSDTVKKEYDDVMDAMRYALFSFGNRKKIKSIDKALFGL